MKRLFILSVILIFSKVISAQQVGNKVSFLTASGKTYTGVITAIQGDKYNIKYDGVDFSSLLVASQFTVIEQLAEAPPQPAASPDTARPISQPANPQPNSSGGQTNGGIPGSTSNQSVPGSMTAADSLKLAITNLKTAFADVNKLFARKSDTMLIVIPAIDYDNSSLAQLKENLKKLKNVRSVTMRYNATTATLQIAYKGKATELWDTLPADAKAAFKLTELADASITLQYKQKSF